MKRLITILFTTIATSTTYALAQGPEGHSHTIDSEHSNAMAILDSYKDRLPMYHLDGSSYLIEHWRHTDRLLPRHLPGTNRTLWMKSEMMKRVNINPPKFLDYNSITLRIGGGNGSLTISNGSAYNYNNLYPNINAAYRDARTLSFPVPR